MGRRGQPAREHDEENEERCGDETCAMVGRRVRSRKEEDAEMKSARMRILVVQFILRYGTKSQQESKFRMEKSLLPAAKVKTNYKSPEVRKEKPSLSPYLHIKSH